jgi:hypothetical protein
MPYGPNRATIPGILGCCEPDENGCLIWRGRINMHGYGVLHETRVHRLIYELIEGPIPPGLQIDHLCRNRACVNADHFELVTSRENTLRGDGPTAINARKTHCKRGHAFSAKNTYINRNGGRSCRKCMKLYRRAAPLRVTR